MTTNVLQIGDELTEQDFDVEVTSRPVEQTLTAGLSDGCPAPSDACGGGPED